MKKTYEKPEIDFLNFQLLEPITDNGDVWGSITGEEGDEEW